MCIILFVLPVYSQQNKEQSKGSEKDHDPESPGEQNIAEGIKAGKQHLVLIAIDKYSQWTDIRGPVDDAKRLKKVLTKKYQINLPVMEFFNRQATKKAIRDYLIGLQKGGKNELQVNDSLFIYHSGHGFFEEASDNGYWIPYNGDRNKIAKANWFSNSELIGLINKIKSNHILVVSDSCFADTLIDQHKGGIDKIKKMYLKEVYNKRSRKVLTSGGGFVPAKSGFAKQFINALEKNQGAYIDIESIHNDIHEKVFQSTKKIPLFGDLIGTNYERDARFILFTKVGWIQLVQPSQNIELYNKNLKLAKEALQKGNYQEAKTYVEKAKEIKITEELNLLKNLIDAKIELQETSGIVIRIKNFIEEGVTFYNDEKYKEALEKFNKVKELNPTHKEALEYLRKISEWEQIPVITPKTFAAFKKMHATALILPELSEKLYRKYPNLPPETYLEYLKVTLNQQGYWEAYINGHIMVYIPKTQDGKGGFFVDKYEVSFGQLEKVKGFKKKRKKSGTPLIKKLTPQHPALVNFDDAEEYCKKKGFRLLTETEWAFVAGKEKGYTYSWGNGEVDAGGKYRANFDDSMDFSDDFETVAPVKSFEKYTSPYGLVNLSGNVWEWVQGTKCKGGGFLSRKEELQITSFSDEETQAGFRCVKEVKE